ncbi:hypothetical protein [Priestia filamentosa]|uniref:hypothetical protein n=1 Tax=Priestia filamentosa TaxID=1402861 RepID=UPI000E715E6A|nr:hypothetical protein [Priestia filamentosa]RJS62779.1 hypothetical protein CJ485_25070 [Priestia filamentosa]
MSKNRPLKVTSIRLSEKEFKMIEQLINSFNDYNEFDFKAVTKNDVIRLAIKRLYEQEIPEESRKLED